MIGRIMAAVAAVLLLAGSSAALAAPGASGSAALREQLSSLENEAEGIAEGEAGGTSARYIAVHAVDRWQHLRGSLAARGVTVPLLARVDRTIAALRLAANADGAPLRRASNDVTGAIAPLFGTIGDRVPPSVHMLDYLGRSIALDANAGDWARATADNRALALTWRALRPQVPSGTGVAAIRGFDGAVAALNRAITTRDKRRALAAAVRSGNAVDDLEKVYGG